MLNKYFKILLLCLSKIFMRNRYIHINKKRFIDLKYDMFGKEFIYRLRICDTPYIYRNFCIYDQAYNNITNTLIKYMGPEYDFFGNTYTISDFGFTELQIFEDNVLIRHYTDPNDIICVN